MESVIDVWINARGAKMHLAARSAMMGSIQMELDVFLIPKDVASIGMILVVLSAHRIIFWVVIIAILIQYFAHNWGKKKDAFNVTLVWFPPIRLRHIAHVTINAKFAKKAVA